MIRTILHITRFHAGYSLIRSIFCAAWPETIIRALQADDSYTKLGWYVFRHTYRTDLGRLGDTDSHATETDASLGRENDNEPVRYSV